MRRLSTLEHKLKRADGTAGISNGVNPVIKRYGKEAIDKAKLEAWSNPCTERDYTVELSYPEFTCLCPRSGYPDFATMRINYIPEKYIVELKSLKLYLNQYRNKYISHEAATNKIYDDLMRLIKPKSLEVVGDFNVRGNLKTVIRVSSQRNIDG